MLKLTKKCEKLYLKKFRIQYAPTLKIFLWLNTFSMHSKIISMHTTVHTLGNTDLDNSFTLRGFSISKLTFIFIYKIHFEGSSKRFV